MNEIVMVFSDRWPDILEATVQHVYLSLIALFWAVLIAVPVGILLTRYQAWHCWDSWCLCSASGRCLL
jgi:osmoprotectant transport system permease protein